MSSKNFDNFLFFEKSFRLGAKGDKNGYFAACNICNNSAEEK